MNKDNAIFLKPCPFCGSDDLYMEANTFSSSYVCCNGCSARGTACDPEDDADLSYEDKHGLHDGHCAAARAWNKRANSDRLAAQEAEIERLREVITSIREKVFWGASGVGVSARVLENRLEKIGELARKALQPTTEAKNG